MGHVATTYDPHGEGPRSAFDEEAIPERDPAYRLAAGTGVDEASAHARQANGSLVVAGSTSTAGYAAYTDFALARFTATGVLDPSFGVGGKVTTTVVMVWEAT